VHRDKFLAMKPTRCTNFSNLFLEWNSTCFRQLLCPSSGVLLCPQHWYMLYRFTDSCEQLSTNLYNIYHCCGYSKKLLMMDRATVRNR